MFENSSWPLRRLGQLTTKVGSGATPRGGQSTYLPARTKFALIRSQNVFDFRCSTNGLAFIADEQATKLANAHVETGDVLLNITGDGVTFGRAAIVDKGLMPACVNQHVAIVRPDPGSLLPEWLEACLASGEAKNYIESFNSGGSRRAITKGNIESFEIPAPAVRIQQRLAAISRAISDRIALNHAMNQTLEDIARAIFKSWFIDHDPVHAKAEGRSTGLPPEMDALFPSGFDETQEGMVPERWEIQELSSLARIDKDSIKPYEQPSSLFSHYSIPAYDDGMKPAHEPGDSIKSNKTLVKTDHILLSKLNPRIPRVWLVDGKAMDPDTPAICSTEFLAFSPRQAGLRYFLYLLFTSEAFRAHLEGAVTGTSGSHQRVRPQSVLGMSARVPPAELLVVFDRLVRPMFEKQALNHRMAENLARLRDLLLPRLVSGDLQIPVEVPA